jgi:hypothetical protein
VEERPEGAVNGYIQLAGLTERLRENVNSLHICRAFYISYAYTRVSPPSFLFKDSCPNESATLEIAKMDENCLDPAGMFCMCQATHVEY